jgi:hypothetical protein
MEEVASKEGRERMEYFRASVGAVLMDAAGRVSVMPKTGALSA